MDQSITFEAHTLHSLTQENYEHSVMKTKTSSVPNDSVMDITSDLWICIKWTSASLKQCWERYREVFLF